MTFIFFPVARVERAAGVIFSAPSRFTTKT